MSIISVVTGIGSMVVSSGIGTIVGNIAKNSLPANAGKLTKFTVGAGSIVLGAVLGDMCVNYVDKTVTETVNEYDKLKELFDKETEEETTE